MNLLDVNVLVALFRADHVHHQRARAWWDGALETGQPFTVPDLAWVGFFRLVTNRRVFSVPATFVEAAEFHAAVTAQDLSLRFVGDARTMQQFLDVAQAVDARGDLVTDAYIAATALTYGATVVTFDRDFRKFDGVRLLEPA